MKIFTKSLLVITMIFTSMLYAEELTINGSFEEDGSCAFYEKLKEKGFKLNFKENEWSNKWFINEVAGKPQAIISLEKSKKAPDGERYLSIKNAFINHIFYQEPLPGDFKYQISFFAKGSIIGKNYLTILCYLNEAEGKKSFLTTTRLDKLTLTPKWTEYTIDIPAQGEDKTLRFVFEFMGNCYLDNIKIKMVE